MVAPLKYSTLVRIRVVAPISIAIGIAEPAVNSAFGVGDVMVMAGSLSGAPKRVSGGPNGP